MGLLPIGIDNKIVQWRAKEKKVDVFIHDASGVVTNLSAYTACFYAKKYPIDSNPAMDISVGHYSLDCSQGKFTFNLLPCMLDLTPGDYVYQVNLINGDNTVVVLQDTFSLLNSLETNYTDFEIKLDPSSFQFTIFDMSTNLNISGLTPEHRWRITEQPDWLTFSEITGIGNTDISVYRNTSSLVNEPFNRSVFKINCNVAYFDASFYYSTLILSEYSHVFTPDTSTQILVTTDDLNSWYIPSIPSWITYDISSGNGVGTFTLNASTITNKSVESILVKSKYSETKTLNVSFDYNVSLTVDSSNPYPFTLENLNHTFTVTTGSLNPWTLTLPSWLSSDVSGRTGNGTFTLTVNNDASAHGLSEIKVSSLFGYSPDFTIDASFTYNPRIWSTTGTYFVDGYGKEGYYFTSDAILTLQTNIPNLTAVESSLYVVAGGGGGGGSQTGYQSQGGGGGGGAVAIVKINASIGIPYNIVVGLGGEREYFPAVATNGGKSIFGNNLVVTDGGGAGGGKVSGYDGKKGGSGGGGGAYYDINGNVYGTYGNPSTGYSGNVGAAGLSNATSRYDVHHTMGGGGGGSAGPGTRATGGGAGPGIIAIVNSTLFPIPLGAGGAAGDFGNTRYTYPGTGGMSGYKFEPEDEPGTSSPAYKGIDGIISILWTKIT